MLLLVPLFAVKVHLIQAAPRSIAAATERLAGPANASTVESEFISAKE